MISRFHPRRPQPLAVAALTLVLAGLAVLLLSTGARARADDFLRAFRVQEQTSRLAIIIAPFPDPPAGQALPDLQTLENAVQLGIEGGHTVAVLDDAQALLDFSVSRLGRFVRPSDITVYQDATAHLAADPARLQGLVTSVGGRGAVLPAELANTQIEGRISAGVRQRWDTQGLALTYWQLRPPHLQTTSGPGIEQLRSQAIQAYFLIEPEAAGRLLNVQDWDHTIVVPVPPGAHQRQVRVDREQATLVESPDAARPDSLLVWQHRGIFNYLRAPVTGEKLLSYTESLGGD